MTIRVVESLAGIPEADWNRLLPDDNPFVSHAYLKALETSGAVGEDAGWVPVHLVDEHDGRPRAALPLYLKDNSWGEFVFDFAWAEAYRRAGREYYPKLVAAVPFTPVPGPRFLAAPGEDVQARAGALMAAAREQAAAHGASSLHILFPEPEAAPWMASGGLALRQDCQFHWRDDGYGDFQGFLAALTSSKRKKLKRERRRVAEAGIGFRHVPGAELSEPQFHDMYRFYASSFLRRGMTPYFPPAFWRSVLSDMGDRIRVVLAERDATPVACAIFFIGGDVLYGRYWGCDEDFHSLHFETCFYQGIELALAEGLSRFEPGAQGEHKLRRGFRPVATWSGHWLADPGFHQAIDAWLARERAHMAAYMESAAGHLPFRQEGAD
ncbi:MAG: GNAT family N-acetyltransferase [Gammaproteobacteria bacterium]